MNRTENPLTLIAAPTVSPVDLAAVKDALRIDHRDDDQVIAGKIAAAVAFLDGPEGYLGQCLINQTWAEGFRGFPVEGIRTALGPVRSVSSIKYFDADGAEQTLSASAYEVTLFRNYAEITPLSSWPSVQANRRFPVTVEYVAGFGATAASVPPSLIDAITLHAGALYEARHALTPGANNVTPLGFDDLVKPYRKPSF